MAFSNYSELQLELADRMHRDDLTTRVAVSVQLATKRLSRELRLPEMEAIATTTVTSAWTALPIDFQEIRSISADSGPLSYRTPWQVETMAQASATPSVPVYTIADMSFRVYPTQSSLSVTLLYYAKIPDFVSGTDTNWLLDKYPDVYIECAMADLCKYVRDYQNAREHEMYVEKFIEDTRKRSNAIAHGSSPLEIKVY